MQERYGLDRRPIGRWVAVGVVALAFAGILAFVTIAMSKGGVETRLITWEVVGPDHVDITYQASPDSRLPVDCVLRAQDANRIDVGYATATIPPQAPDNIVISTFALRTLAPAYTVELLGCAAGGPPQVPPPQFPPGVVPPDQPFVDDAAPTGTSSATG
jgi:hypothetical protein